MTLITRLDPFREFVTIQDRMNRLLRDLMAMLLMAIRAARSRSKIQLSHRRLMSTKMSTTSL